MDSQRTSELSPNFHTSDQLRDFRLDFDRTSEVPKLAVSPLGITTTRRSSSPSAAAATVQYSSPASSFRRFNYHSKPFIGYISLVVLIPLWLIFRGSLTLDSFNDYIRYLPGYNIFANNLIHLVTFLLFASFLFLAAFPTPAFLCLGLPLHLLIVSIFNRLFNQWLTWLLLCYLILVLAPFAVPLWSWSRTTSFRIQQRYYSPLQLSSFSPAPQFPPAAIKFFSHAIPHARIRRLLLAFLLCLSFVIPATVLNESRYFDPSKAIKSFDIQHPKPLCSGSDIEASYHGIGSDSFGSGSGSNRRDSSSSARMGNFDRHWQEYLSFHQKMLQPKSKGGVPFEDKRFLIFQPSDDGLGNRLQGLLSAVVMAITTRRAIILDWQAMPQCNADFEDLFIQPDGLDWYINGTFKQYKSSSDYEDRPKIWLPYCRNCALRTPMTPDSIWSQVLCQRDLGLDPKKPIIELLSTQWFLPVIQHNSYWRSELCQLFPDGGKSAFQILGQLLLQPSRAVQQKMDTVLERIQPETTLIGLQVRRTENNAVDQRIEDSFLSCAAQVVKEDNVMRNRQEKMIDYLQEKNNRKQSKPSSASSSPPPAPPSIARSQKRSRHLHQGVVTILNREGPKDQKNDSSSSEQQKHTSSIDQESVDLSLTDLDHQPKFAYFLATDYRPTRAHFQHILGDQLLVLDDTFQSAVQRHSNNNRQKDEEEFGNDDEEDKGIRNTRQDSNLQAVVRNTVRGVQTAVAEMLLLAASDRIIVSPYSTFGYFAHGYANVPPNIVTRDGRCITRKSTQPCFQYWFGFANGGAACPVKATIEMSEDYDCWL